MALLIIKLYQTSRFAFISIKHMKLGKYVQFQYLFFSNAITAPLKTELPPVLSSIETKFFSECRGFRTIISESRYTPPYLDYQRKKNKYLCYKGQNGTASVVITFTILLSYVICHACIMCHIAHACLCSMQITLNILSLLTGELINFIGYFPGPHFQCIANMTNENMVLDSIW